MLGQIHEQLQLDKGFPFACFGTLDSDRQQFLHVHDCLELNIVQRGEGCYIINGKKYPIQPGDIFVINNQEPHMAVHEENLELTVLVFDIELLWNSKGVRQFLTPFLSRKEQFSHRIAAEHLRQPRMAQLFCDIKREYEEQEIGWQIAVESLLLCLLTMVYRCYDEKRELEEGNDDFQRMYTRISAVFGYIERNFREKITLDDLAQQVSLSPHYLCKCFKKVTGRTIFEYVEQMRIQYSCYLLQSTERSVMEIAMESGFNSVSYYNRTFKKYKDATPKEYRKRTS